MSAVETVRVMDVLHDGDNEAQARFIGGCVRDALLGKEVKDIDIATIHKPEKLIKLLEKAEIKAVPTGIDHGTITAIVNHKLFEITTLRRDVETYGRHAKVEFTYDWKEDAARRDFTFNAISIDKNRVVYDYFDGMKDLAHGVVRFVGDPKQRIKEDYLRILRYFRFHSYYGRENEIPEEIAEIIAKNVEGLRKLSGERIKEEMFKILISPDVVYVVNIMDELNVLRRSAKYPLRFLPFFLENIVKFEKQNNLTPSPLLRLAGLIIHAKKRQRNGLIERWKLSNKEKERLIFATDNKNAIDMNCDRKKQQELIYRYGKERFRDMVMMSYSIYGFADTKAHREMLEFVEEYEIPQFPLGGDDILALGVKEGEEVGRLLEKAEKYWIEKDYKPDKNELVEFIKNLL